MRHLLLFYLPKLAKGESESGTCETSGGSKGGDRDARPPLGVQILSFSCSFRPKNRLVHPLWELAPPPSGNHGSATGNQHISQNHLSFTASFASQMKIPLYLFIGSTLLLAFSILNNISGLCRLLLCTDSSEINLIFQRSGLASKKLIKSTHSTFPDVLDNF